MPTTPHLPPMLSIESCLWFDDAPAWIHGADTVIQPKLDGVALQLAYVDGSLVAATLRTGRDVTPQARELHSVPQRLREPAPGLMVVRGEVVALKAAFEDTGKSLRHIASSRIKSAKLPKDGLAFYSYSCPAGLQYSTEDRLLELLAHFGFQVPPFYLATDDVPSWARAEMIWRDRADLPFQIDGAVIKIRYRSEQDDAGSTPYAPRWALAAKWMCC
jgi:DNA ligase (NAD+)